MTDHWKDVGLSRLKKYMPSDAHRLLLARIAAARANDAQDRQQEQQAHAAALAEKDAEIADLTRKLHWFTAYTPCHWTKGEIEYTTDCGQIAFPASKTPDGKCHGCGRPIVVS